MKTASKLLLGLSIIFLAAAFQIIKTSLNVTVRDEMGNTVKGATVQLFESKEDWEAEKNIVAEGISDEKGYIKLKDLKAISYFVLVKKDDKDNTGGGEQTEKLEAKKNNKVTIVIQ